MDWAAAKHAGYTTQYGRNEDEYSVNPIGENSLLVIVCDGHSNDFYSKDIVTRLYEKINTAVTTDETLLTNMDLLKTTLTEICRGIQNELLQIFLTNGAHQNQYMRGGTTCTFGLVTPTHILLANIGDSPGVLCRMDGSLLVETIDQDGSNASEAARVSEAGGFIAFHNHAQRLNGMLMVTRAFGDFIHSNTYYDLCKDSIIQQNPKPANMTEENYQQAVAYTLQQNQIGKGLSSEPVFYVWPRIEACRLIICSDSFKEAYIPAEGGLSARIGALLNTEQMMSGEDAEKPFRAEGIHTKLVGEGTLQERVESIVKTKVDSLYFGSAAAGQYQGDNTTLVVVEVPAPAPAAEGGRRSLSRTRKQDKAKRKTKAKRKSKH